MFKQFSLALLWFVAVPLLITISTFTFYSQGKVVKESLPKLPLVVNELKERSMEGQVLGIEITDTRPYIVEKFFAGRPLAPHSKYIVETSDKYGLDYRLIPAIAMKESQGGAAIDQSTHNAWGFENGRTVFTSWESAIDTVGKTLKLRYYNNGMISPEEIMPVYAPPQLLTGGKWAKDINHFFSQMDTL